MSFFAPLSRKNVSVKGTAGIAEQGCEVFDNVSQPGSEIATRMGDR